MVSATDCDCAGDPASCTATVNDAFAVPVVGVPEITPVAGSIDSPGGNVPVAMVHAYGDVPPLATSAALYGIPVTPAGREDVAMPSGPGAMVSGRVVDFSCAGEPESCTTKVSGIVLTAVVGVPDRVPVELDSGAPWAFCHSQATNSGG